MDFEKFPKIENLGRALSEKTVPAGPYLISEKLDGSNAGIIHADKYLILHSRNQVVALLSKYEGIPDEIYSELRGFVTWASKNRLRIAMSIREGDHLYGEWLVPHTIKYPTDWYGSFYAFPQKSLTDRWPFECVRTHPDAFYFNGETGEYLLSHCQQVVEQLAQERGYAPEGVVLVNVETGQRFKYVTEAFREDAKNKWSPKKAVQSGEVEQGLAALFSVRRYEKIREKAFDIKGRLDKSETPIIMQLAWDDFCQELLADGLKQFKYPVVDTKALKHAVGMRAREMFHTEIDTGMLPQWALHGDRGDYGVATSDLA